MDALIQFLFAGLTEGSRYALAALGFTLIYNASGAINFAQGDAGVDGAVGQAGSDLLEELFHLLPQYPR